jgi:hypothetical protein
LWAHKPEDAVPHSADNAATLNLTHPRSLKIEPEIVFGLKQPVLSGGLGATAALEGTDWLAPGFEIIDYPFAERQFQPGDFVASFALHAALVAGGKTLLRPESVAKLVDALPRFTRTNVQRWRICGLSVPPPCAWPDSAEPSCEDSQANRRAREKSSAQARLPPDVQPREVIVGRWKSKVTLPPLMLQLA